MKAFSGSGPVLHYPWVFCALALLFLSACALTPGAEEGKPSNAETVDIGYGTVDKDQVSGSVTTVESKDVVVDRSRTLAEMLARVPGVRVTESGGGNLRVRIRDTNSFLGGEDPLFVIDGMVFNGGLGGINPNTIESITVLKNAGETAIYGSRGANGVILIKTKEGSK
jgi:TonB-dependent SusC/RagA subfamily outer membrane receptor